MQVLHFFCDFDLLVVLHHFGGLSSTKEVVFRQRGLSKEGLL